MGFRITMGMKMNSYRYNLMQSTNAVAKAQEKVETHRKFNSYAESPAAATNAWRVRQNYMDNDSYIAENDDTVTRYQTGWLAMGSIKTDLEQYLGKTSAIRACNDATGEAKKQLGDVLSNAAETVIQAMNGAKYGDEFVFGGTDGTTPPFSWDGEKLLYRGINLTPPSMLGGTQRWPEDWGDLKESGGFDEKGIPENFATITADWKVDDTTGKLEGTYTTDETTQQMGLVDKDGNAVSLPLSDADGKPVLFQATGADGEPAMIALPDGTFTPVVDADGNPIKIEDITGVDGAPFTAAGLTDANGDPVMAQVVTENKGEARTTQTNGEIPQEQKEWYVYFKNVQILNKLSAEVQYADLGMGLNEDENVNLVDGTYFNNALPGINMLGYGVDNDGDPKNLALLMKEFDNVLATVNSNGTVQEEGGNPRVIELLGKFDDVCEYTLSGYTKIETQSKFLTANADTLSNQKLNLNEQIVNLENIEPADAITQFLWDYNCYNAALKIGTQLLSQSLLDYMR